MLFVLILPLVSLKKKSTINSIVIIQWVSQFCLPYRIWKTFESKERDTILFVIFKCISCLIIKYLNFVLMTNGSHWNLLKNTWSPESQDIIFFCLELFAGLQLVQDQNLGF